ncbi:MAG TPA: HAMP domain-containing sensor histidine kinase [Nitrososphaeraceae archaeon]|nr:HAMP domain-containing sensor histidine kinase [Nitrososphaeraceae archaeon]
MLKHDANTFRLIRSKIGLKIAILVVIQVIFIITSFSILSYYESQGTYLGNSINIAGKNRFLTSNLMLQTSEYFFEGSSSNDVSKINSAMDQLETNILALKEGGKISDVDLKPLPSEFLDNWNTIYQKWVLLKTTITKNIIEPNEKINPAAATTTTDKNIKTILETRTVSLVDSSNVLVTQLGEYARNSSQNLMFLQAIFAVLNIAVAAVVLYLVMRILKPIFALTRATSEISRGNLDVSVKSRGNNDELSVLSDSFNFMVNSIKNNVNKQNELTKKLKDANEELKYNDRLKDEFINVAAHELRSPIQPILGLSEFLRSNKGRGSSSNSSNSAAMSLEKEEELLDVIVRNSKRLRQLAEDILDVAKIEGGSLFLKKERFNIKEMITEILSEYEQKIKNIKNIKLSYDSQGNDSITIEADKSRLCQVVYNLLSNAIKFTTDGSVTVIAEKKDKDDNFILLSIHDTGTGIDSEMLPKLFTKFATKSQTGGTGLGLFISKSIIERHGGKMWAENNSDGKGSTFAFSLPLN